MATFTYRAFDSEGLKICGAMTAANEAAVKQSLEKENYASIDVFESKTSYSNRTFKFVSPKEISIFCRQMSVMFFSHITLMEGVLLLSEQTTNKQLKSTLKEIYALMDKGYTLAETMGMYRHIFTSYMLNMVQIGETSGTLDTVFLRLSEYYDKESKMRKKMKSAITYPAILTVLMGAIVVLLIVKILPMFEDLLKTMGGEMPGVTKAILSGGMFINQYFIIIVAIIAVIVIALVVFFKTTKGAVVADRIKVKAPIFRYIFSRMITARFSRSLSILIKSGVQLVNALDDVKSLIDNKYLDDKFEEAIKKVKNGEQLEVALADLKMFPPLFLKMVYIGQTTGHIDDMLDKSADIFDDEVDESIERLTTMLEPILIIILSIVVGIILVSVMLPMISIMNSIG